MGEVWRERNGFPKLYFHYHFVIIISWKRSFIVGWLSQRGKKRKRSTFLLEKVTTIFYRMVCTPQSQDTIKIINIIMYNKYTKLFFFFCVLCGRKLHFFFSIIWLTMAMELTQLLVNITIIIQATYVYTEEIIQINKLPFLCNMGFKSNFLLRIMLCLVPHSKVFYISFINWIDPKDII